MIRRFHSDRGTAFANEVLKELARFLDFEQTFTSLFHPQGNPYAERFMKPLVDALTHYVNIKQNNWDTLLPAIMFAYNTHVHVTTGDTPFYLANGRDARMPVDMLTGLMTQPKRTQRVNEDGVVLPLMTSMSEAYESLHKHLMQAAQGRKKAYDTKQLDIVFVPGNIVMVHYDEPHRKGESTKFTSKWIGPFRVIKQMGEVTYKVKHVYTGRETEAHVNRLRKIRPSPFEKGVRLAVLDASTLPKDIDLSLAPDEPVPEELVTPKASTDDGAPAYEMEAVLNKRTNGPVVEYLIKFRGYSKPEWVLEENILGQDLLDGFEKAHPSGPNCKPLGRKARLNAMKRRLAARCKAAQSKRKGKGKKVVN